MMRNRDSDFSGEKDPAVRLLTGRAAPVNTDGSAHDLVNIGTSLAIIALNSCAGLLGQLRYIHFDWWITLAFLGAAVTGMFAGLAVANQFTSESLRRGFAWCVIVQGIALLAKNAI